MSSAGNNVPPLSPAEAAEAGRLPLDSLLAGDVAAAAAGLIGCVLERRMPDGALRAGRIVEAEAYHMREPGSHAYRGMTPRNAVMFGPPGRLYVYFTYGMWHCCNVVCEAEGVAAAVLLRAAGPLAPDSAPAGGLGRHSGAQSNRELRMSGPGLLCQALGITREDNGADVLAGAAGIRLYRPEDYSPPPLTWTTRIGFSFPDPQTWRCYWTGHPAISPGRLGVLRKRKRE